MAAVLVDAIGVLFGRGSRPDQQRLRDETWNWVMAEDPEWPFSFENVCQALGLDPDRVRGRLGRPAGIPEWYLAACAAGDVEPDPREALTLRLVS